MPEIGETLREARMRQRIDMSEVEAATKIRAKYLRALESEEWELLPGPTFVKTFLRTYADYLELDSRLLVEEYKQRFERPAGMELTPLNLRRQPRRRRVAPRIGPGIVVAPRHPGAARRAVRARPPWGGRHAGAADPRRADPDADRGRLRQR